MSKALLVLVLAVTTEVSMVYWPERGFRMHLPCKLRLQIIKLTWA